MKFTPLLKESAADPSALTQEYAEADFYRYLLINDDADKAAARLCAIIDAEHCRFADLAGWLRNQ